MEFNSNDYSIPTLVRTIAPEGLIHNLPAYNEGELWHSYLNRVAIENGIPDAKTLLGLCSFLGPDNWTVNQKLNYDCMKEASRGILKTVGDDWILTGTLFAGLSPLSTRLDSTRRIYHYNFHSRLIDRLTGSLPAYIQNIKICPECRKNEGEGWYFHTDLQMPDVTVCPIHGCALMQYTGNQYMEHSLDEFSPMVPLKGDDKLSVFETDFFKHGFHCDSASLKTAIIKRLFEIGHQNKSKEEIPGHEAFERNLPSPFAILNLKSGHLPASTAFLLMCLLFKDVNTLEEYIPKEDILKEDYSNFSENYELLSPYRDDFIVVKCKCCGTVFPTTPYGIITGWGCPGCLEDHDYTNVFSGIVDNITGNSSLLISPFSNWSNPIKILDKESEKQKQLIPRRFADNKHNNATNEAPYEKEVESKGDFTLLSSTIINEQVSFTIRHNICGNEFAVFRTNFLISPICRKCEARKTAEETFHSKLAAISTDFHIDGVYDKQEVSVTDGKVTFSGKPNTVLAKVDRYINPRMKKNREKAKDKIRSIVGSFKGRIFSTRDVADKYGEIDDKRVITNYLSLLGRKKILKNLANGLWCHSDETYEILDVLMFKYVRNGLYGCPIGVTAMKYLGLGIGSYPERYTIAVNYTGETDNHRDKGMGAVANMDIFKLREHVTPENFNMMMFVASVWHEETMPASEKEDILNSLLDNALDTGYSMDQIISMGDRFPPETARRVRQIINIRRVYGKSPQ